MKLRTFLAIAPGAVLLGAFLQGCDGDGELTGTSVPDNPAIINTSNYIEVAAVAYGGIGDFLELGSISEAFVSTASLPENTASSSDKGLLSLTLGIAKPQLRPSGEVMIRAAAVTECPGGGTVTDALTDRDSSGNFSVGDTLAFSFSSCQLEPDGIILDGRLALTLDALSGDPSQYLGDWFISMDADYASLKVSDPLQSVTVNGQVSITAGYDYASNVETGSLTGSSLTASSSDSLGEEVARWSTFTFALELDYNNQTHAEDADYTLASTELDGVITVTTNPVFVGAMDSLGNMDQPTQGVMIITGANNARITVEAQADATHALVSLDEDGDGIDEVSQLVPWTTLSS